MLELPPILLNPAEFWQLALTLAESEMSTMRLQLATALLLALILAPAAPAQDNGGIKQDTKDAAHATARATKKTGRKIKHGTKKVVHKGAHATGQGTEKIEDKTRPSPTPPPER